MHNGNNAIFGGDFNPFHLGHAFIIKNCLEHVDHVTVYFSVHKQPPERVVAPLDQRKRIVQKWIELNGLEKQVEVYSGNKKIADLFKDGRYSFNICGSDIFNKLEKADWRGRESFRIAKGIILVERPSFPIDKKIMAHYTKKLGKELCVVPNRLIDHSASNVRETIQKNDPIDSLVPTGIERLILEVYEPLLRGS